MKAKVLDEKSQSEQIERLKLSLKRAKKEIKDLKEQLSALEYLKSPQEDEETAND